MSARLDILNALRGALDDLQNNGSSGGWAQDGVMHTKDFRKLETFKGRGRIVYAWLGPETAAERDSVHLQEYSLELSAWGVVILDKGAIEIEAENMLSDLKRAMTILDDTNYPEYSNRARVTSVTPLTVSDNEAHILITGNIIYVEAF